MICVGKIDNRELNSLIEEYTARIKHYYKFSIIEIPNIKRKKYLSKKEQKLKESELIQKQILPTDYVVVLDEKGKHYSSEEFSIFLNKNMVSGIKRLIFLVGGAYGFSEKILNQHKTLLSLSKMTFSHQMVRLFFVEQLYRGFSILNNEPYHHK
tara:strand:- start:1158 stop:1619 length:462 start_codon:yes stop_codon:yes gene_type:complete